MCTPWPQMSVRNLSPLRKSSKHTAQVVFEVEPVFEAPTNDCCC